MTIYPVLIEIPHPPEEKPPERMIKQRDYARRALRHCAMLTGAPEGGWLQAEGGAPLPNGEFFWSISHTRGLAAAVIAKTPVGIDVERIRERRDELFLEVGTEEEWRILGGQTWPAFFALWTAKEAVVKANSLGIAHIDDCCLLQAGDAARTNSTPTAPEPHASACADARSQGCLEPNDHSPCPTSNGTTRIMFRNKTWRVHHHHLATNHVAALATTETHTIKWSQFP